MSKACPLFLVFPGTSNTPLLPPSSAGSRDRAPSSNRFRIAAYLDPQVGLQGTWGCDKYAYVLVSFYYLPYFIMTCSQHEYLHSQQALSPSFLHLRFHKCFFISCLF